MSEIRGRVGAWEINWKSIPSGETGRGEVEVKSKDGKITKVEVSWKLDENGVRLQFPSASLGFDLQGEKNDEGRTDYRISQRGSDPVWIGASFLRAGEENIQAQAGAKKKGVRVRAQMPGKIVKILVKMGALVAKDQSLALMEAMKMENEIRAPQAGVLTKCLVDAGQAVETGADLFMIEPE